ncbi:MAG: NUDIX hydrolase [Candidatus Nanopelagicales bacterium]|nr:NUDIX hydrolase [Candidatus Nanopelagicales bacterium]
MLIADARPAATVILMREAATGFETFLMRRSTTMRFAPGMYVFPGGRVDDDDFTDDDELSGYMNCAVREVQEETGVVLGKRPGDLVFADHWVTPEFVPERYSARFFLAKMPVEQTATSMSTETDLVIWISPADALVETAAGRLPLLLPTLMVLQWLAEHDNEQDLVAAARSREIKPKLPRPSKSVDGTEVWAIVDADTGEILIENQPAPKLSELTGLHR